MPRFNYLNSLVKCKDLFTAQHHHLDFKIQDTLIRKGTHNEVMSNERSNWVQMVLSLPIDSGGFGVTPKYASRDSAFYAVTARWLAWAGTLPAAHHELWLPKQILDDHATWTISHLVHLPNIQNRAVSDYGCLLADDDMMVPANAATAARATHTDDDSKKRYLWWKPMAWLGIIRPMNSSEKWHIQQWSTFFCMTLGLASRPASSSTGSMASR